MTKFLGFIYREEAKADQARPNSDYKESIKRPGNYNTLKRLAKFCETVTTEDECIEYLLGVSKYQPQEEWDEEKQESYRKTAKFSQTEYEVRVKDIILFNCL